MLDQSEITLEIRPGAPAHVHDEAFDAEGRPRPWWQALIEASRRVTRDDFLHRCRQAQQQLRDNGVAYNVFQEGARRERPWRLDLLPVIQPAAEWRQLEAALRQRARLLELLTRDCHGPRRLARSGLLPLELLYANPGFSRAFQDLHASPAPALIFYAAELARRANGEWIVMADRAEAPVGAGFALENRIVCSRAAPQAMHSDSVERLAPFFLRLKTALQNLAGRHSDNPRVVMLSAGAGASYYFEDVYLARYLGFPLVEGGDLAARDDRVYLKTLAGLLPVDVILNRGEERGLDPLELGGAAPHGVPGVLHAARRGRVALANKPGCGLVEAPVFMAFLPALCRHCLGEELLARSIPTWWCGDPADFAHVRDNLERLVIKPAFQASGGRETFGGELTREERAVLLDEIAASPRDFVAQELIARSAVPVFHEGAPRVGHVALRVFLVGDGENHELMPGGLVRYATSTAPMELSIAAGVGSKDLWVLAEQPVQHTTLLSAENRPVPLRRTQATFPSRVADDLFWLGQSLDRADFLGRVLRAVIERLTAESTLDAPELPALVRALADQGQIEPGFAIAELSSSLPGVEDQLPRMVADAQETRGLSAALAELGRLASLERLWISPETWRKIHETVDAFRDSAASGWTALGDVLEALNQMILDLAAVSGLIHDGMIRGPAWRLLDIGRRMERARDVANLLRSVLMVEAAPSRPVLRALLEVLDCRMTYRARYTDNVRQNAVFDLALTDETCPRSLASQLAALADHVDALPHDMLAPGGAPLRTEEKRLVMAALHAVRMLPPEALEPPRAPQLRELLGEIDQQLRAFSDLLTRKYLLHSGQPRQISAEIPLAT